MTDTPQLTTGALKGILSKKESSLFKDRPIIAQVSNVKMIEQKDQAGQQTVRYRVLLTDGVYLMHGLIPNELVLTCEQNGFKRHLIVVIKKYELVTSQKHIMVIQDLEIKVPTSDKIGGDLISVDEYYKQHPDDDIFELANGGGKSAATPLKSVSPSFEQQPKSNQPSYKAPPKSLQNRQITPIEQLSPYQNQWTIKARVSYKGDIRKWSNARGEGKLFNVNFLDELDEIRATAFNELADKYFQELEEGKVYLISKARIQQAKPQFSHLSHPYELSLDRDSIVEECFDVSDVPKIQFNFTKLDQIQNLEANSVTDVVGVLKEVNPVYQITAKSTGKPFDRRNVTIVDDTNFAITVGLWNNTAVDFSVPEGSVIAFKGCKVQDFGGRSLTLTHAGTLMPNPDTAEAFQLKGWYDNHGKNETYQTLKSEGPSTASKISNRKTILQAEEENLGMSEKPDFFNVKATINFFKMDNFCYPACNNQVAPLRDGAPASTCNRKVVESGDGWRCEKCDLTFPEPEYRYIVSCSIMDSTGQLWTTLFDEQARGLFGVSAGELLNLKARSETKESADYTNIINAVSMKEFDFRLKARQDSYNGNTRIRYQTMGLGSVDYLAESEFLCSEIEAMLK